MIMAFVGNSCLEFTSTSLLTYSSIVLILIYKIDFAFDTMKLCPRTKKPLATHKQ